jgi:hypothetical protein
MGEPLHVIEGVEFRGGEVDCSLLPKREQNVFLFPELI